MVQPCLVGTPGFSMFLRVRERDWRAVADDATLKLAAPASCASWAEANTSRCFRDQTSGPA